MDYANELHSGKIVAAKDASSRRAYKCPRPGCGGRVYLPDVVIQRPHFRHYPGEGTSACDEYYPDFAGGEGVAHALVGVEEDPAELGMFLSQCEGRWALALRLPEIPSEEFGEASLIALRLAFVDVYTWQGRLLRLGALDLRPGVGAGCVEVDPALQTFRTEAAGSWPSTINLERWRLESRGLEALGVLFRLRQGEWRRLGARSAVHHGETLLVLFDRRFSLPKSIACEKYAPIGSGGIPWAICEVQLPTFHTADVKNWLARIGHQMLPRKWSIGLVTPPRAYSESGEPIFWMGDFPVLTLEAPQRAGSAMVSFHCGTNEHSTTVRPSQLNSVHVGVSASHVSATRLTLAGERGVNFEIHFGRQLSRAEIVNQLAKVPRLRLHIGSQLLEAWQANEYSVGVQLRDNLEVHVDLFDETVRARVTVWEHGKQWFRHGLDVRGTERVVGEALSTASRIEVDADNLGRVIIIPTRAIEARRGRKVADRLQWHDEVACLNSWHKPDTVPTLVGRPGSRGLVIRRLDAASLIRSRLSLRRRLEFEGMRP